MEEFRKKIKVLEYSLHLENFVSIELAQLLDIPDYKKSKSLGNSSSSLSVNQKLNLLLDVENIDKKEKVTIENFMSIRNQFMHNIDASSFSYVIKKIDGLENKLKKEYPENFKEKNNEVAFELCVGNLFNDSIKILKTVKGNKLRKIRMIKVLNIDETLLNKRQESFDKNIKILEHFIENYPENKIEKNLILTKVIQMNIEIEIESGNDLIEETNKMKNPLE